MNDLISVVVPVYNIEDYIDRCITSIVRQTYQNLEIILVDDGSRDGSGKKCDEWAKKDCRIRVIHKENGGLSDARNCGMKAAKGEFYSFIDGDDGISENMVQKLYETLQATRSDIAMCRIKKYERTKTFVTREFLDNTGIIVMDTVQAVKSLFLDEIDCSACPKLYCKSVFNNIEFPVGRTNEDFAVMYKVFINAKKISYLSDAMYFYYQRENSITTTSFNERQFDKYDNCIEAVNYIEKNLPEVLNESKFYLYRQTIYLLKTMVMHHYKVEYPLRFSQLRKTIFKGIFTIITCKWLSAKEKGMYIYISLLPGLYEKQKREN